MMTTCMVTSKVEVIKLRQFGVCLPIGCIVPASLQASQLVDFYNEDILCTAVAVDYMHW